MTHADAPFPSKPAREKKQKKPLPLWMETILLLVIALVLAVVIKSFFVQAFYIPSPSMEPQFIKNDRILVEKPSYWGSGTPQRGDIVVFKDPGGWLPAEEDGTPSNSLTEALSAIGLYPAGGHLVKRVIGIGGDRVDCPGAAGPLEVNGHPLHERSYLPKGTRPCALYGAFHIRVPQGDLWVMGDNRGDSADSRAHMGDPGGGFVPDDLVVGKVFALVWPPSRAELIHRPADFTNLSAHQG
ncbi:signal peptidase I [Nocardioides terrisoli]|uniref:signal peptidase I n=1 Tax=Nocardioides terrisoli TaxID=3388267 RepID=UPI00287B7EA9|nr:signal peptidase I [Nocardioides marmorisolisilvae]